MNSHPPRSRKPWTWRDGVFLGVMLSIPVGMVTVAVSAGLGNWLWALLTVPVMVILTVVVGWIAEAGRHSRVFVVSATVVGLLMGLAAGVALIGFGVSFNLTADTCDPESSRCVLVIDGVVSGESTMSVGSQRFSNFLLSLAMILPGFVILFFCGRSALKLMANRSENR